MSNITETTYQQPEGIMSPSLHVAPSPHISDTGFTTQRMMIDVLIGLLPLIAMSIYLFKWYAVKQLVICMIACLCCEALFVKIRNKSFTLKDCSAAVTAIILALSLPAMAPWYVGVIASVVAIGIGKVIFGGLGMNIFNPAMVGRAFVMIAFAGVMGASAYEHAGSAIDAMTQATPMNALKQAGVSTPIFNMFFGFTNGSLGETSALLCILGGLYLCYRRTASWEIPVGALIATLIISGLADLTGPCSGAIIAHHLFGGALLFGIFFIATDPVTSPLTPKGKMIFGFGVGTLVMVLRLFSGYPEGVMFAILLMNAMTPLINRWTVPDPMGYE